MNILEAIRDRNLFRPFLQDKNGKLSSWGKWAVVLRMLYGLPIKKKHDKLVKKLTGRSIASLPKNGFGSALLLVGRRGGKSSIAAVIASYEAVLGGKEVTLSPGETGMVSVLSPTRLQSTIIRNYIRAALNAPLLEEEIVSEDKNGFSLSNGIAVQILTGDFRVVRGFSQILVLVDEICFFGMTEECKKSDSELITAIRPALLTSKGKLVCISTKYSKRGWAFKQWKKNFGNDGGKILIIDATSIQMNPTLNQADIDEIIAEDPVANRAEFLNEWREDISAYISREIVESCVKKNRIELLPNYNIKYIAFCDLSGGKSESASIAISHKESGKVVLDFVREYKAPFNPNLIIERMVDELRKYRITRIVGDRYAGEFVSSQFRRLGIRYIPSDKSKSVIYLECIPILSSRAVELLDNETMVTQFCNLQRKTRSGGADSIDHMQGFKDDVCNSVAGSVVYTGKRKKIAGALFRNLSKEDKELNQIKTARLVLSGMAGR